MRRKTKSFPLHRKRRAERIFKQKGAKIKTKASLTWCQTPIFDEELCFGPFVVFISNLSISIKCALCSNLFSGPSKFVAAWLTLIILNFLLSANETVSHSTPDWSKFALLLLMRESQISGEVKFFETSGGNILLASNFIKLDLIIPSHYRFLGHLVSSSWDIFETFSLLTFN